MAQVKSLFFQKNFGGAQGSLREALGSLYMGFHIYIYINLASL